MAIVYIKNMVCPRCIDAVKDIFNELKITTSHIDLGEVELSKDLTSDQKSILSIHLKNKGFELLEEENAQIIARVKGLIIDQIHHKEKVLTENFSTYLATKMAQDYSHLSKLFSSTEGITIEKFIVKQKIEKVKELIVYNELNFSEIAFSMEYSSVAHLSTQFKKETGMTPTAFKQLNKRKRNGLDTI